MHGRKIEPADQLLVVLPMISLRRRAFLLNIRLAPPDWRVAFGNDAPIEVDLGCGRGTYAWQRALQSSGVNIVALDVRRRWIQDLRKRCLREGVANLRAVRCDVNEDLPLLFKVGSVSGITIHHPDPWWKKRHRKRRMVRPALVEDLARLLAPGGWIFVQTDVPDLAEDMRTTFNACEKLITAEADKIHSERMGGLRSHREQKCLEKGIPILRMAFVRKDIGRGKH
jgi:tRNA (guanine-N7-)-methyltransferase